MNSNQRISMILNNLRGSQLRYDRGEISREQFDRLARDAKMRIQELKRELILR